MTALEREGGRGVQTQALQVWREREVAAHSGLRALWPVLEGSGLGPWWAALGRAAERGLPQDVALWVGLRPRVHIWTGGGWGMERSWVPGGGAVTVQGVEVSIPENPEGQLRSGPRLTSGHSWWALCMGCAKHAGSKWARICVFWLFSNDWIVKTGVWCQWALEVRVSACRGENSSLGATPPWRVNWHLCYPVTCWVQGTSCRCHGFSQGDEGRARL